MKTNFWNKKANDLTVLETIAYTVVYIGAFTAGYKAGFWVVYKADEIGEFFDNVKEYWKKKFTYQKAKRAFEDEWD